jgi:glutathione S-transferase
MDVARLITIPLSHYCEKARWVLDATGVRYREEPHAPLVRLRATRAVGGRTVPVLVHDDVVLLDSSEIARHADHLAPPEQRLIPARPAERARVLALEDDFDETLGVDARLIAYWHQLRDPERARALVGAMMHLRSRLAQRVVASLFRRLIFRKYRIDEQAARHAEARVRSLFERLADAVDEEPYLVGGRFTLADLTLAALSAPLLAPPEHPVMGRLRSAAPPAALAALRAELSATPVGRRVLQVYAQHRRPA